MLRLFQQHQIRKTTELDGMWDFKMDGFDKSYRLAVPGCFEQHPDFLSYRGTGVYTKKIYLEKDCNLRLEFKGVSHTADVSFDGEKIAHHYNAFTPFSAVIKGAKKGAHTLRVRVDNTFSEASALHVPNDYYTYGGITRPVGMEEVPDLYIRSIRFTPYPKEGNWFADVEIRLRNLSGTEQKAALSCQLLPDSSPAALSDSDARNGAEDAPFKTLLRTVTIPADGEAAVRFTQEFPGVAPWSHAAPNLYYYRAVLFLKKDAATPLTDDGALSPDAAAIDDLIERVGFRQVTTRGRQLLLNGEPLHLMGFNRHEDYASLGCAIPLQLMVQDMDLMEAAGANAVRTCHYPNDERFLDLCDERGMLVWEENHARGFSLDRMENPNFDRQCRDCIDEMIENHYNHPSIFIWGILNECASETEIGREKYAGQYAQIRSLDASRPVTSATCRHFTDICLDLPDVVSFNMYSGWYEDIDVAVKNDQEIRWIDASGGADKPIIVSEVGAGAVYGYRDRARSKWSEERQADVLRENLEVYLSDPRISGVFIWQFADCRVTEEEWFQVRPRSYNNKGVVDEYRRPKIAYDTVCEIFRKYQKRSEGNAYDL